jgi:uncharacterized coiled-coil DUF342 family protein
MEDKGTELDNKPGTGENIGGNPDEKKEEKSSAATQDDIKKLVGGRDRANEKVRTLEQEVAELRSDLSQIQGEADKKTFLDQLAAKYPGVDRKMLDYAGDPDSAEALAKDFLSMKESAKQEALKELQTVEDPRLDPQTAAQKLKELEGTGDLEQMFDIKMKM